MARFMRAIQFLCKTNWIARLSSKSKEGRAMTSWE
jgi:hypothetical protein